MDEQIKKDIDRYISEKLEGELSLLTLPLKSEYRILEWDGVANGTPLAFGGGFTIADIRNRVMIIKSFKLIPYYAHDGIDFNFSDGTTETVFNNTRINRLFDFITVGTNIDFILNGVPLVMFMADDYPADLFVDNIYYKYPENLQTIVVQVNMRVVEDLSTGAAATPNVRVVVECYLI